MDCALIDFDAMHSHLFAGAKLRCRQAELNWRPAQPAMIHFADLGTALACVTRQADMLHLQVTSHETTAGTAIAAKDWHLIPETEPGLYRLVKAARPPSI